MARRWAEIKAEAEAITLAQQNPNGKWLVQVGKGKGAYTNKYAFPSDQPVRAELYYDSVVVHSGHKKRLVDPNGKVKLREIT